MIIVNKLQCRGFSLVELSVSLAIISMIVGSAISVAVTNDYATKKSETQSKLNRIEEALAGFVAFNKRLPCPANGATPISNTNFGQEGTLIPSAAGAPCPNSNFTDGVDVQAGVVPVDTLQLPDDFMFDGWGRRITYAVDTKFTNNETTNTQCLYPSNRCFINASYAHSTIEVRDATGAARTTNAVYILISHGENGHGAFTKNGSATRLNGLPANQPNTNSPYSNATASADELENAELDNVGANTTYDSTFVMRDYIRVDDESAADSARFYFDDIVRYKLKNQIVKESGEVILTKICKLAEDVINNPGNNGCTGVVGEEDCESFAIEMYQRCIK